MTPIVLLDGGVGQEIVHRSNRAPDPLWSATVMMDDPELVAGVHADYAKAGAKVLTINTYTVTPERLARDAVEDLFEPLQRQALSIAADVRERADTKISIAGCLPPLFASYHPELAPPHQKCLATYRSIVLIQAPFVDFFLCETLASVMEAQVATTAAAESGKPVWTCLTVKDKDGSKLRSGEPLADGIVAAKKAGASAILVNCTWPEAISDAIDELKTCGLPFGGYANGFTGIEPLQPGGTVETLSARNDLDPEAYARHAMEWVANGATIIGGCCEVGPAHIAELAKQLETAGHAITGDLND